MLEGAADSIHAIFAILLLVALALPSVHGQGTHVGFYSSSCPQAESIVRSTVESHFKSNPRIAPGILRMHFHDCFIRGCDASILVVGPDTEKTSPLNLPIQGFEVIDDAKSKIEAACPGIVSCADILALAARDAVVVTRGLTWEVPTGRRDGRISLASDAADILRAFTGSVDGQKKIFLDKGLNTQDLVTLVGGHTIGTTSCRLVMPRLYNFPNSTTGADPSIDPTFLPELRKLCPQNGDAAKRVALDMVSPDKFDTSFFTELKNGRGVLGSDQLLWSDDESTKKVVQQFLGFRGLFGLTFSFEFGKAMVKMSNIEVKTGTDGEIRKLCTKFN